MMQASEPAAMLPNHCSVSGLIRQRMLRHIGRMSE